MKRFSILCVTMLLMASCAEEIKDSTLAKDYITFTISEDKGSVGNLNMPDIVNGTRSSFFSDTSLNDKGGTTSTIMLQTDSTDVNSPELYLQTTDEYGINFDESAKSVSRYLTRGEPYTSTSFAANAQFGVSGYKTTTTTNIFSNETATVSSTTTKATVNQVWPSDSKTAQAYDFYAYYPLMATNTLTNGLTLTDGQDITYSLSSTNPKDVPDLMTAKATGKTYGDVPLTFCHELTAVVIKTKTGFGEGTIKQVKFKNIYTAGSLTIGDSFTPTGSLGEYTIDTNVGKSGGNTDVYSDGTTLMMLPQAVGTNGASIEITIQDATNTNVTHTVSANLTGSWTKGHKVTYTVTTAEITEFTLVYPAWDNNGTKTYGPINNYAEGESVGLFAVDNNNQIVIANKELQISSVSTPAETYTAGTDNTATINVSSSNANLSLLSQNYKYYIMYPYNSTEALSTMGVDTGPGSIFQIGSTTCKNGAGTGTVVLSDDTDADTFFADVTEDFPLWINKKLAGNIL